MNIRKLWMAAVVLSGGAVALTAYASRRRGLRLKARELQNALEVWENEGGIVHASTAQPADPH